MSEVEPAPSVSSSLLPSSSSSTAPKCTTNKLKIAEQVPSVPKCTNKQTNDSWAGIKPGTLSSKVYKQTNTQPHSWLY